MSLILRFVDLPIAPDCRAHFPVGSVGQFAVVGLPIGPVDQCAVAVHRFVAVCLFNS